MRYAVVTGNAAGDKWARGRNGMKNFYEIFWAIFLISVCISY